MRELNVTIGDIADLVRGVTYDKTDARSDDEAGYLPLLRATNIVDGQVQFDSFVFVPLKVVTEVQRIRLGDILLAASSGSLSVVGKAALVRSSWLGTFGAFCYVVRPNPDLVLPEFLGHFMQTSAYRRRVSELAAGVNINNLRREHVLSTPVPYIGLAQQQEVVETLDSVFSRLDAAGASLEAARRRLKAYRASLLKAALEGRLVPTEADLARTEGRSFEPAHVLPGHVQNGRSRRRGNTKPVSAADETATNSESSLLRREPRAADGSTLRPLPDGWAWASLEELCSAIVDCPHSTPAWSVAGRVCVRTTEFRPGYLDLSKARFVSEETYTQRIARLRPEPGDILYSREGGILGIACPIPTGVDLCLGQRMMLLRATPGLDRYLMHVLNSPWIAGMVRRLTGGSASPHLNVGEVRRFPIPLPPPSEIARIVEQLEDALSIADASERQVATDRSRLMRLRQSVLTWAFNGKLVDQSNDEPADALLARFRAQRATGTLAQPSPTRARKLKAAS
jgi:type I restriction enzyme S subunit